MYHPRDIIITPKLHFEEPPFTDSVKIEENNIFDYLTRHIYFLDLEVGA